ncbi:MAG: hypothetical protein BIP78_1438 [Candidatus Bipolaricaulis sibiricus]|uniref:Uncharacterized protein n=1 Tax=Bipolaricaulis sibiricus TaxID=2501609 RepID=A0A410FW23_BIPS1|nr:MAG: hypothetical protein BIP78_1438 [Candidatus Bipolaricaulis sibiricus]
MSDEEKKDTGDVQELREVLSVVSQQVPGLLKGLRDVLYSKEAAENMADAVGTFYKKLVDAGIPKDDALEMARGYMINLREVFKGVRKGIKTGEGVQVRLDGNEEDD